MKKLIYFVACTILLMTGSLTVTQAQGYEIVTVPVRNVSAYENKSFYYTSDTQEINLLPGFTAVGSNAEFFVSKVVYNGQPATGDQNYVRTEVIRIPGITTEAQIQPLTVSEKSTSYQFIDGLGRKSQSIVVDGSPNGSDIIAPVEYDAAGRELKKYLPFTTNQSMTGMYLADAVAQQTAYYTTPPTAVAGATKAYTESIFESSPLNRLLETIEPRDDPWNATQRSTTTATMFNAAGEVPYWNYYISGFPVKNGTHAANTLIIEQATSEEGAVVKTYKTSDGVLVMNRSGKGTTWSDTHFIYSASGLLMFVIQPEGVERLVTEFDAVGADKQSFLDRWAFQYRYDDEQRKTEHRTPGFAEGNDGWSYTVYDQWNRVVLTQHPEQRKRNEYSFNKYDRFNRVIAKGLYTTTTSLATLRTSAATASVRFETEVNSTTGYTLEATFPPITNESNLLEVIYYDNYQFLTYTNWDAEANSYGYVNVSGYPSSTAALTSAKGKQTGAKIRTLALSGSPIWLNAVMYYDFKYNNIQTIAQSHRGGTIRSTSAYTFTGKLEKTQTYNSLPGLTRQIRNTYDHANRLINVYHQVNAQPEILMTSHVYNEIDQLIEKNIHSVDNGVTFLQSIDQRYNIKGWITHINNATLTNEGANNDTGDLFGMELMYYASAFPGLNPQTFAVKSIYDGNVSVMKWKTDTRQPSVTPVEQAYAFDYDQMGRLKEAYYGSNTGTPTFPVWTGTPQVFNENITGYDKNGNISGITRSGNVQGTKTTIDNLTFGYTLNGKVSNRLVSMEDASGHTLGFKPAAASIPEEYKYDATGNLTFDHNKGITSVVYNHLNLVKSVEFTRPDLSIEKIEYLYDAKGNKLRKIISRNGNTVWWTDYEGGIQYDKDVVSFITTPEGRVMNNNGTYDYEYFFKDHLGNVRVTYGLLKETVAYRATMETQLGTDEEAQFKNIATSRYSDAQFNYTRSSVQVVVPDRSARTNGFTGNTVGPAKSIRVLTGDKVYMETFARYNQVTGSTGTVTGAVLLSAMTGPFGIVNAGETATLYQSFNTNLPGISATMPASTTVPKAYLIFIFFNDSFAYVRSGAQAITTSAYNAFEKLSRNFTAEQDGYLYVYVANETSVSAAVNVYFDETYIIHQKNTASLQVVQAADYYPFGLSFNDYQTDRLKDTGSGAFEPALRNRNKFHGKEVQSDLGLDWYDFEARMYEPAFGKFLSVDAKANEFTAFSPYNFTLNNPVMMTDPDGKSPVWSSYAIYRMQVYTGQLYDRAIQKMMNTQFVINRVQNYVGGVIYGSRSNQPYEMHSGPDTGYYRELSGGQKLFNTMAEVAQYVPFAPGLAKVQMGAISGNTDMMWEGLGSFALDAVFEGAGTYLGALFKGSKSMSVTDRLLQHMQFAESNYVLSAKQLAAGSKYPNLMKAYTGSAIDKVFKAQVNADDYLRAAGIETTGLFKFGPDAYNPLTKEWWDLTTPPLWDAHQNLYTPQFGTGYPLFYTPQIQPVVIPILKN